MDDFTKELERVYQCLVDAKERAYKSNIETKDQYYKGKFDGLDIATYSFETLLKAFKAREKNK